MSVMEMIIAMRGGIPESCDFCGKPFNDLRRPVPDEAGEWSCTECWKRWEKEDAKAKAQGASNE